MFRTEHARRERCDVRVLAELHKPRCSHALLVDNWRAARRQRFFRDSKEVACSSLDIGSSLGYVLPSELGKDNSMLGFNRYGFCRFHSHLLKQTGKDRHWKLVPFRKALSHSLLIGCDCKYGPATFGSQVHQISGTL